MNWNQCPKRLWLQVNRPEEEQYNVATEATFDTGQAVGKLARSLFPGGVLINEGSLEMAVSSTANAINKSPSVTIFEATFTHENVLIKTDILVPDGNGYKLIEVKSSTGVHDHYYLDAAIQYWVIAKSGVPILSVQIMHIDNTFEFQGDGYYDDMFKCVDVTDKALLLQDKVQEAVFGATETLEAGEPEVGLGKHCGLPHSCPFLNYCIPVPSEMDYSVFDFYRLVQKARDWANQGIVDVAAAPVDSLNATNLKIREAILSGKPFFDRTRAQELDSWIFPRYYLDFETVNLAIPVWEGARPYEQIPFQWSCHIERSNGEIEHLEFLADPGPDPRREFAESLCVGLGDKGAVIAYNAGFEKRVLESLANRFLDLEKDLNAISDRMVDLLPVTRDSYYHPDQHGSWALKAVLPTIAPELSYSNLSISNGGQASDSYAAMLYGDCNSNRQFAVFRNLLKYCDRDTLAMIKIVHILQGGGEFHAA